uniref:Uncharacterized protein n=1 Tax=uncultured prokaryote TaxID=198431 RepID=A0A0H5Q3T1_9ZZZZ|nr:hypothetical protein [uncultured prokaryote]
MIVIRQYAHGAGVKVRLEQHLTCCDDGNCGQPDEDATERSYAPRDSQPREYYQHVLHATARLIKAHSYARLVEGLCYQERLPL